MSTALTVSSDDFFYNLGALFYDDSATYGQTPIQNQAAQYGLGELTGIDLPGEAQGRVDSQAERLKLHAMSPTGFPNTTWYTGDNMEMAFGQGATVITPIEQAVAYSTFANGGTRYAPQVAAAVVSQSGKVVKRFTPKVTGHVNLPPTTYDALLTGFTGAVQNQSGTAYGAFQGLNFPGGIAGKTGTADSEIGKEPTGLVRRVRPDRRPPVRGGVRDRPGRLRGHGGGPGGAVDLRLPGHPPGLRHRGSPPSRASCRRRRRCPSPARPRPPPPPRPPRHRAPVPRRRPRRPRPGRLRAARRLGRPGPRPALRCRGRCSPSGHVSNPSWPRSPSRPATSAENWEPR